jgi:hypothetical protein
VALSGEVIEIGLDLLLTHIFGVAFAMEHDVLTNPKYIGFFSFRTEMFLPTGNSDLL